MRLQLPVQCAVCGSRQTVPLAPRGDAINGKPGLDLRPAGVGRLGTVTAISECTGCGYTSPDLAAATDELKAYVRGADYAEAADKGTGPALAVQWYRWYLVTRALGDHTASGHAAMRAAWTCDDAGAADAAIVYRRLAIRAYAAAATGDSGFAQNRDTEAAVLTDLHRRVGDFEVARTLATGIGASRDGVIASVATFELALIERADVDGYTVGDAQEYAKAPDEWFALRAKRGKRAWWAFWQGRV